MKRIARRLLAAHLAEVSPEAISELVFLPHPAARLVPSRFAAGSIFVANREFGEVGQIDPMKAEWVLITRPVHDCSVRILAPAQGCILRETLDHMDLRLADCGGRSHLNMMQHLIWQAPSPVLSGPALLQDFDLKIDNEGDLP